MNIKFAPFGIGFTNLEVSKESIQRGGNKAMHFTQETGYKAAEVSTRYLCAGLRTAADVLNAAADKVDDGHQAIIDHARGKGFNELVAHFAQERAARLKSQAS